MRSRAIRRARHVLLIVLLGTVQATAQHKPGVGPCEKPPGDKITCERNQLAKCTVDKGTRAVEGQCQSPPSPGPPKGAAFDLWVLQQVVGEQLTLADMKRPEYQRALKEGRWDTGTKVVTFSLPQQ